MDFQTYAAPVATKFVNVARLRSDLAGVLALLRKDRGPVFVTQRGQPRAVLLDVAEYRALTDQLEHLDDSIEVLLARERREAGEATRPLAGVVRKRRLGQRGSASTKKRARPARARVSR